MNLDKSTVIRLMVGLNITMLFIAIISIYYIYTVINGATVLTNCATLTNNSAMIGSAQRYHQVCTNYDLYQVNGDLKYANYFIVGMVSAISLFSIIFSLKNIYRIYGIPIPIIGENPKRTAATAKNRKI